jgi:hypothetical protein
MHRKREAIARLRFTTVCISCLKEAMRQAASEVTASHVRHQADDDNTETHTHTHRVTRARVWRGMPNQGMAIPMDKKPRQTKKQI